METVPQAVWRWKIAAYLFLAGTGAGAVIVGVVGDFLGYVLAAKIAIGFGVPAVALSTLFLIMDLGRPAKFLTAILHPGTSWISRGVVIISALLVSGGLTVALWVWPFGGVLEMHTELRATLEVFSLIFAVATCTYTGILIGIWVTPAMTLDHLLFAAGSTVYIWIGVFFEERSLQRQWGRLYEEYRERVGTIVPTFTGRRRKPALDAAPTSTRTGGSS